MLSFDVGEWLTINKSLDPIAVHGGFIGRNEIVKIKRARGKAPPKSKRQSPGLGFFGDGRKEFRRPGQESVEANRAAKRSRQSIT